MVKRDWNSIDSKFIPSFTLLYEFNSVKWGKHFAHPVLNFPFKFLNSIFCFFLSFIGCSGKIVLYPRTSTFCYSPFPLGCCWLYRKLAVNSSDLQSHYIENHENLLQRRFVVGGKVAVNLEKIQLSPLYLQWSRNRFPVTTVTTCKYNSGYVMMYYIITVQCSLDLIWQAVLV